MVGHTVAPYGHGVYVRTPFGEFVCSSTATFYVRYVYTFKDNDKPVKNDLQEQIENFARAMYGADDE